MGFKAKFWGVRGSLPSSPLPATWSTHIEELLFSFFRSGYRDATDIKKFIQSLPVTDIGGYGCNTTCVELRSSQQQVIIDGGSGIRSLSEVMMRGPAGKGKAEIHIFMTHFHWDHVIGLPFFAPHFVKGNKIHYYAVQPDLEKVVRLQFHKPCFPVPYEALGAAITFHQLEPRKPMKLGDITVTPYQLDHPDPCWGYRFECENYVYSHCVDTEATRTNREALGPDLPLYQGVDLMYFDAQYTLPELAEKANWGHSAAQLGLEIAIREGVKNIIFGHHDPGASISNIHEIRDQTKEFYDWKMKTSQANNNKLADVKWKYAHDGLEFDFEEMI